VKVKPKKEGRARRRAVTISIYALGWLLLTALGPLWLVGAAVVGAVRQRSFILLRLLVFAWFYFGLELIALIRVAGVFLVHRDLEERHGALYELQAWWATMNLRTAQGLLELRVEIEGAAEAASGPSIMMIRHASILDTLLPCTFVQRPYGLRVRYILKQELLFDPCIDIVGNALPNYFVDRTGDRPAELDGIRSLVGNLGDDGVLIFPEGTRFSAKKLGKAVARLEAEGSPVAGAARSFTGVLPPKHGGVLTLLDALPGVDCVFFAHTGLETFVKIASLLTGAVVGSTVRIKLWRIPASQIPSRDEDRLVWLYDQWTKVDAFVTRALSAS
jgi:1-acyl-sn-glycerol-3-phosphate acyltransferase